MRHPPFGHGLSSLVEEEAGSKRRRTSSYHDPLGNRSSTHLLPRGERYQSAIALASGHSPVAGAQSSLATSSVGTPPPLQLSVREKADTLSIICETVQGSEDRGKIIAVEGDDIDMVQTIMSLLKDRLDAVSGGGLYSSNFENKPAYLTNESAINMWKISYLHQILSELKLEKDQYGVVGGYLITMADSLAAQHKIRPGGDQASGPDTGHDESYRDRWLINVNILRGLPAPDYLVYLQPQGLTQDEVAVAELKGGTKMLVIGGNKDMAERIVDKILKTIKS